jgi:hypothetical protein
VVDDHRERPEGQHPDLPLTGEPVSALVLVPAIAAATGLLLAAREVGPRRRGFALLLAVAFGVALGLGEQTPLALLARSIGALALAHALGTDLHERMIDLRVLVGAIVAALSIATLDRIVGGAPPLDPLIATLGLGALSGAMWLGGRFYARLRGLGIDPLTGERAEAFGAGDIPAWMLVGATIGSLPLALSAFIAGTIAGALFGLALIVVRGIGSPSDGEGNAPDDAFIPLLPAIISGCAIVLAVGR